MDFVIVILILPVVILAVTLKLSTRRCHFIYFLVDTAITGFFFIYGSVHHLFGILYNNSGENYRLYDPSTFVTSFWLTYMLLRFIVILVYSVIMAIMKQNFIDHSSTRNIVVIAVNIPINILTFIGIMYQVLNNMG
jgi:hypothetical protein